MNVRLPLLLIALLLTFTRNCHAETERPNFLFIAIDDLKPILGSQSELPGNFLQRLYPDFETRRNVAESLTPNIDSLAESGVSFNRAFCPSSVCRPSRTALMTGLRPHISGVTGNNDGYFRAPGKPDFVREVVTLPQFLKENGYFTAGTGKIFHTGSDEESDAGYSWNQWFNNAPAPMERGKRVKSPWSSPSSKTSKMIFGADHGPIEGQEDYGNANLIATLLESGTVTSGDRTASLSEDQPFFLACGIFRPHLPLFAPKQLIDLFDPKAMDVRREMLDEFYNDLADTPDGVPSSRFSGPLGQALKVGLDHGKKEGISDGDLIAYREAIRHYLASVALADRCVGRLLDALEASPYADNTVVILWSDHGWYLGEKYLFLKTRVWDEAANCVLVVKDPREGKQGNGPSNVPVNLQDLYPTIANMARLQVPPHVAGTNITPLILNPNAEWEVPSLTTWHGNESIRHGQWAYLRYDQDPQKAELYHIPSDPDEMTNLIDNPDYQEVRSLLNDLLNRTLASGK